jgi:hypothetical protein
MTPPSARPCRLPRYWLIVLFAPLTAFAQAAGTPAAPAQATPSQAAAAQVVPARGGSSQTPPSQATPARANGSPASRAQPASTAAPNDQVATAPASGTSASSEPTSTGPSYDIEIVIFRAKTALGQPEKWDAETSAAATVAGGEASSGSGVGKLLTVLPSSDYRLTAIASRLGRSGPYLPVAHAAWVQTASAWGTHAGFPLESLGVNVPGLTGVISLERGQYLHLGMTLNYTMQDPPPGLDAPPGTTFVMNETRRVRFYQRNYYDHPAFGVIALITPARGRRPPGR